MTIKVLSGVVVNTSTTGTGTIDLGSAVSGFWGFDDVSNLSSGDKVFYAIEEGTNREVGVGTFNIGTPNTLSRDTVIESTNSDDPISLGGNAVVFATMPGSYLRTLDENGNFDLQSTRAINVSTPTADSDAATKGYTDTLFGVTSRSNSYTITDSDHGDIQSVDASGGTRTITAPDPSSVGSGFIFAVRKSDSSGNNVTINPNGSETFDGASSLTLQQQYERVVLRTDGTDWIIVSGLTAPVNNKAYFRDAVDVSGAVTANSGLTVIGAIDADKGADIASSSTINLDDATGNFLEVTGTTDISGVTLSEGVERTVRFTNSLTLVHGSSLQLPNSGSNINTSAGDVAVFRGGASGVVYVTDYQRQDGDSVAKAGNVAQSQAAALDLLGIFS